jgi:hypothetical protein
MIAYAPEAYVGSQYSETIKLNFTRGTKRPRDGRREVLFWIKIWWLAMSWLTCAIIRLAYNRPLLWLTFLSFPLPFVAIITRWFTAEVGRQPWVVYGVLRTADAMTQFLTTREATISLVIFCAVYAFIFLFGTFYICRSATRVTRLSSFSGMISSDRYSKACADEPALVCATAKELARVKAAANKYVVVRCIEFPPIEGRL